MRITMTEKIESEKEQVKETKSRKKKQEIQPSSETETAQVVENIEGKLVEPILETISKEEQADDSEENDGPLSSLDILWHNAFRELDEWARRGNFRDDVFLKEAMSFAENIQRNQGNIKAISEKFNQEIAEWERTAREEFLMSTTSLQHFFPIRSYEEINAQIDQIQKRTMSILSTPCQVITDNQAMDKYIEIIDKYIALRKKGRKQYIKTVKQAGNLIYENQKGFVNLFARQIKTIIFPLNKYLEKTEKLTK
jgi:hypothetical protein